MPLRCALGVVQCEDEAALPISLLGGKLAPDANLQEEREFQLLTRDGTLTWPL